MPNKKVKALQVVLKNLYNNAKNEIDIILENEFIETIDESIPVVMNILNDCNSLCQLYNALISWDEDGKLEDITIDDIANSTYSQKVAEDYEITNFMNEVFYMLDETTDKELLSELAFITMAFFGRDAIRLVAIAAAGILSSENYKIDDFYTIENRYHVWEYIGDEYASFYNSLSEQEKQEFAKHLDTQLRHYNLVLIGQDKQSCWADGQYGLDSVLINIESENLVEVRMGLKSKFLT